MYASDQREWYTVVFPNNEDFSKRQVTVHYDKNTQSKLKGQKQESNWDVRTGARPSGSNILLSSSYEIFKIFKILKSSHRINSNFSL